MGQRYSIRSKQVTSTFYSITLTLSNYYIFYSKIVELLQKIDMLVEYFKYLSCSADTSNESSKRRNSIEPKLDHLMEVSRAIWNTWHAFIQAQFLPLTYLVSLGQKAGSSLNKFPLKSANQMRLIQIPTLHCSHH
jgi:hypothetical protein